MKLNREDYEDEDEVNEEEGGDEVEEEEEERRKRVKLEFINKRIGNDTKEDVCIIEAANIGRHFGSEFSLDL